MTNERTPLLPTHAKPSQGQINEAKQAAFSLAKAAGALKAGKLPSQSQLDALLTAALDSDVLSTGIGKGTGRLSEDGTRVVNALRNVIEAIKTVGEQKNGDDKVQDGIYAASQIEPPTPATRTSHFTDISSSSTLPSRKELDRDSDKMLKSLSKIMTLLVTSPQFRLVINQAISLSASIIADASGKIAEKASEVEKQARETGDDDKPIDLEEQKRKGKQVAKKVQSGRYAADAREAAMNSYEGLERYFEDKISGEDEARDKLFEKLQSVVKDVQSNPDYQKSIDTILSLLKKYYQVAEKVADEAADKAKDEVDQGPLHDALGDGKALVEAFASGESLDPVLDAARNLKEDVSQDHRIESFFSDVGNFLEACLKIPGYVTSQRAYRRSSALWDRGQKLMSENDKYKKDADQLVKELEQFGTALSDDPATSELATRIEELGIELTRAGKSGLNALKAESTGLYRDFVDVVLPRAIALIKEIPAPRTEFKSADVDFVVDDVKFVSASFIPREVRVVNHNDLIMSQGYAAFAADYDSSLTLRVEGFDFEAHDISYWINKKTGFITFEDEGLLSIGFDGKGISFDVTLENASDEDRASFFVVKDVNVNISNLEYSISKNSSWLLWFAKPFVSSLLKQNLKNTLEHQIKEYLRDLDLELYGLQQRAIAATNAKPSPLNYVKAVFSPSIFGSSGSSTTKVTQKGVVKHGRRGEYLLAIGVDDQLFPGKAGPSDAHAKRTTAVNKVQQAADTAKAVVGKAKSGDAARAQGEVNQLKIDAKAEANKLGLTVDAQAKKESRKDGWRSDAFDL